MVLNRNGKKGTLKLSTLSFWSLIIAGLILTMILFYNDSVVTYQVVRNNDSDALFEQANLTIQTMEEIAQELDGTLLSNATQDQNKDSQNNMIINSFKALRRVPAVIQTSNGMIQAVFIMIPGINSADLSFWKIIAIVLILLSIIFLIIGAFWKTRF